jgi:hypothetical protein
VTATLESLDLETTESYSDFLQQMEDLGLLENLEDQLPAAFSAVYEIGRILADPRSRIGAELTRMMSLAPAGDLPDTTPPTDTDAQIIEVPAGEEYEAEFIRSWSDVRYVYSWQWLLPEEAFIRHLAARTLWFPMAKAPRIHAIESGEDDFNPSPSKQRVYVLLDTSKSMALKHRFALAKAAVLRFLRENRRELGEVSLRTFDVDVGKMVTATDRAGFDGLMRRIARQVTLGNGTCLEKAILTACEDIHDSRALAGAEILVITDGAARVRIGALREALGDRIRLHMLKLGHAQVFASDAWVQDRLELDQDTSTRRGQRIMQLRKRKEQIDRSLETTHDAQIRNAMLSERRKIEEEQAEIGKDLRKTFGHEIENVAHLYIEIDDLDPAEAFHLSPHQLEALKELVRQLLDEMEASPTPADAMKKAALVMSHLQMLSAQQHDPVSKEFLDQLRTALEQKLEDAIHDHEEHILEGGLLSPADQRDLRVLLHGGSKRGSSLWIVLLRYFYRTFAKALRR